MVIWMEVTKDRYELPVAVADSAKELAAIVGVKKQSICKSVMQARRNKVRQIRFVKVVVEENEEG